MLIIVAVSLAVTAAIIGIIAIMGKIFGDLSWCVGPLMVVAVCVAGVLAIIFVSSMPDDK